MARMKSDIVPVLKRVADGTAEETKIEDQGARHLRGPRPAGYPDEVETGKEMKGLDSR